MIRHWTEADMELYALYRRKDPPAAYIVCQFDPFPTFHDPIGGSIVDVANDALAAVDEADDIPDDVSAALVQYFSHPSSGGTGPPTPES